MSDPFPRSVNYLVTSVLYDQFQALNRDFHRAVSDSGEFRGNIREFRRRHQALSRSVQNADQFMMISNVAGFVCQIINLIVVFYGTLFFRQESSFSRQFVSIVYVIYVIWLATILAGLTLTACQGIVINHVVGYMSYYADLGLGAWSSLRTMWSLVLALVLKAKSLIGIGLGVNR